MDQKTQLDSIQPLNPPLLDPSSNIPPIFRDPQMVSIQTPGDYNLPTHHVPVSWPKFNCGHWSSKLPYYRWDGVYNLSTL
jgi:hypothetical protein